MLYLLKRMYRPDALVKYYERVVIEVGGVGEIGEDLIRNRIVEMPGLEKCHLTGQKGGKEYHEA